MKTRRKTIIHLSDLKPGECGRVVKVGLSPDMALKLAEMGLAINRKICFIRRAPAGDPFEIQLIHYRLALRSSEAKGVLVERLISRKGFHHGS